MVMCACGAVVVGTFGRWEGEVVKVGWRKVGGLGWGV